LVRPRWEIAAGINGRSGHEKIRRKETVAEYFGDNKHRGMVGGRVIV